MLAVDAALVAETTGLRLQIDGHGSVVTCRMEGGPGRFFSVVRDGRRALPALRALIPLLVRSGLRLDVLSGDRRIMRTGSGVRANTLARFLRLPSTHIGS